MTAATTTPGRGRDRVGRLLMGLNALLALGAAGAGVGTALSAADDQVIVEWWRTLGFVVFAALWVVVALRPRGAPGAWEVIVLHKAGLCVVALATGVDGSGEVLAVDGYLAISTIGAYIACRGWLGWSVRWGRADAA